MHRCRFAGLVLAAALASASTSARGLARETGPVHGVQGVELTSWFGAIVPAGVPRPIVDRMAAVLKEAIADASDGEAVGGSHLRRRLVGARRLQSARRIGTQALGADHRERRRSQAVGRK
jgi:hypothetical protein